MGRKMNIYKDASGQRIRKKLVAKNIGAKDI